ncbi:MAG: lysophospholipid acyltransferase family protein [Planctomycetes bacterium]|nr:lysophospholipid acyltransferase family protein [Planctomycetota bacterium]
MAPSTSILLDPRAVQAQSCLLEVKTALDPQLPRSDPARLSVGPPSPALARIERPSKVRSLVKDYLVYLTIRVLISLIQVLSLATACWLARGLAWLTYRLDRRHRLVAADNWRAAFPGQFTEAEIQQRVQFIYRHFCTMLMEMIFLPRKLHHRNRWRYMDYADEKGKEQTFQCLEKDRPYIIVTGHLGNWEMFSYHLGLCGFRAYAVARPLDNPFLDRLLQDLRESTGQKILSKHGDLKRMENVLKSGGVLGFLADQDAGSRGLFVDFFGRPASTHRVIASLALKYAAPVLVLGTRQVGEPMCYQIEVEDIIRPEEYSRHPDGVRALTQRYTSALERLIRRAPEQYFWLHRRWKTQPREPLSKG